jgi:hypothetical protein
MDIILYTGTFIFFWVLSSAFAVIHHANPQLSLIIKLPRLFAKILFVFTTTDGYYSYSILLKLITYICGIVSLMLLFGVHIQKTFIMQWYLFGSCLFLPFAIIEVILMIIRWFRKTSTKL